MRHLVRWHKRLPAPPEVRLAAGVAAIVMAFVAVPDPGLAIVAPEVVNTPVAPSTALDRSTGSFATISLDVMAVTRWRVVKPIRPKPSPVRSSVPTVEPVESPAPTAVPVPGCDPLTAALAQDGIEGLDRDQLQALMTPAQPVSIPSSLDPACPASSAVLSWYLDAREQAIAARAESRRVAILEQRQIEERRRQLAARRAAAHTAQRLAAARAAAVRTAQRRAAAKRAAVRRANAGVGTGPGAGSGVIPAGWRNAPIVTWYGPGFYGKRTACGVAYTRTIVGVAHKTLPCGTLIRFVWHGMTAVAPVIDRGPYASAAYVFDFSAALSCDVFRPKGIHNSCFTRHDVRWQVVGKVNLRQYLAVHGH